MDRTTFCNPAMPLYVCSTCGTQYPESAQPPATCPICEDERQWVPHTGQSWTTLDHLQRTHRVSFERLEPSLYALQAEPGFAINQRALLVKTPVGNMLWDCMPVLTDAAVDIINALGGLHAIAISHPHYYSTMVEWARAFGVPVWLHESDREHVMRPDNALRFWSGDTHQVAQGLTLIRTGGHFEGGTVLHWAGGAQGAGALLVGDIIQVAPDHKQVSFMRSYPNMIPLDAASVRRIDELVAPYPYEAMYGAFYPKQITRDAKRAMARSVARYLRGIGATD
jgi:hypothetical protein